MIVGSQYMMKIVAIKVIIPNFRIFQFALSNRNRWPSAPNDMGTATGRNNSAFR